VTEFETLAVGPETQRFDLANPLQALLQQLVFQGQIVLLGEFRYYRSSLTRSISIIIPAYNEEKRLPGSLRQLIAYLERGGWRFAEILVVDDGSTDGTVQAAGQMRAAYPDLRVLRNPGNRGKGYAVRHGMLECRGEWALFTDADLSTPIEELEKLWQAAEREGAQLALGSRALDRRLIGVHQSFFRENVGKLFNLGMRLATGLPFHDTQCGFKLFETRAAHEIFRRQLLDGFGFDVEVLFIGRRLGYREIEVPVRWNDVEGTKMTALRGLAAFLEPWQVRWNQIKGRYT
jgi:glycosyltransferase involved in cell wall biosynthesis